MTKSETTPRRDFEAGAAAWDDDPRRVKLSQELAAAIGREVAAGLDRSLLDYGAGTGLVTLELAPLFGRVLAVDSSAGMLAALERKAAARSFEHVRTALVDHDDDGPVDSTFDVVISSMTMHHVRDPSAWLARLCARLAPGGTLAIADLDEEEGRFHLDPTGVFHHGFARAHVAALLVEAGCREVRVLDAATVERPHAERGHERFGVFLAVARR